MKIFISHSAKDKWAAREIAKQIEGLGAVVFIDEKDIKTGESIDAAIRRHLVDSDHFLLILTPASVKSEWVLLELGGALALGKTVVPILLYVGANEVPQAINLKLARDINDIDRYYEELKQMIGGSSANPRRKSSGLKKSAKRAAKKAKTAFPVGSTVKIVTNQPNFVSRKTGTSINWTREMDPYLGLTGKVTDIDPDGDVSLDIDNGKFAWAPERLAPVDAT
jgi:hypothetical protein